MVTCLERGADWHMAHADATATHCSCYNKIQIGFTFLVLTHPGSPGQRAVKRTRARARVVQDDVADAFIVQLFDAVKSPRCYAVVAVKRSAQTT